MHQRKLCAFLCICCFKLQICKLAQQQKLNRKKEKRKLWSIGTKSRTKELPSAWVTSVSPHQLQPLLPILSLSNSWTPFVVGLAAALVVVVVVVVVNTVFNTVACLVMLTTTSDRPLASTLLGPPEASFLLLVFQLAETACLVLDSALFHSYSPSHNYPSLATQRWWWWWSL